ncbi:MAG TPA: tetratricopeptide repeat protein, partial [Flavobacteriales bacterium]|nr:tetratricopeptide repeat protein [Flavobacteriales bacterium]
MIRSLLVVLGLSFATAASAQSGKAFFKEGEKLRMEQQLDQALEKYNLAIQVEPGLLKAYQARADVYELLGKKGECAADRKKVAELDPSDPSDAAAAARAYVDAGDPTTAASLCDQALKVDPKNMDALQAKVRICLAQGNLDCASSTADAALAQKATTDTYYLHGLARMATRDYRTAEFDLDKVIEWNYLYEPAYVALAETQLKLYEQYTGTTMQMRTLDKAVEKCTRALELNPQSTDALFTRSKAYAQQKEYAKAIDDISKCVALGREDAPVYYQRALYYHGFGQHQNAVNDLNKVLLNDPKNVRFLLLRAECRESNLDLDGAIKDLDVAQKLMEGDAAFTPEVKKELAQRRERIAAQKFEQDRESDAPVITVVEPYRKADVVQVSSALARVKVTGHVRDKSTLKSIRVQDEEADFPKDEKDPEFFITVPLRADAKEITVLAMDVYDNVSSVTLKVERTEGVAPSLVLTSPKVGADKVVTVSAGKDDLFLEGRATDASGIRSVTVDGVFASFAPDTISTDFSIKLPIKGKDRFTVRAEDQFGNSTEVQCSIQRKVEAPVVAAVNPKPAEKSATGTTWVVYIENSSYKTFPTQGNAPDGDKMRKAFSKYAVQRTITRKNLSKQQLERFFNIELRDMVRSEQVNTVLVWYEGQGRSAAGKTYWVPVDAKKDDIYTYYNYGPLKNLVENYSESVRYALVLSGAAGNDPS